MTRPVNVLTVSVFWLITATLTFCQSQAERQPCPDVAAETTGCELIAWSHLQDPVPLPHATSPPDGQSQEAAKVSSSQSIAGVTGCREERHHPATGPDVALLLDDQEMAQSCEGNWVMVAEPSALR